VTEDFFAVATRQRACRSYAPDPIPVDDVSRILEVATHAPSAHNSQPWVFVVVMDATVRQQVSESARSCWEAARTKAQESIDASMFEDVDTFIGSRDFGGAPVLVVLGVDLTLVSEAMVGCSIFPAAQNLMLAASALSYGSTFTNFTVRDSQPLADAAGLPAHIAPCGIISIGLPAKPLGPPRREPVSAKAHLDRYGQAWP